MLPTMTVPSARSLMVESEKEKERKETEVEGGFSPAFILFLLL